MENCEDTDWKQLCFCSLHFAVATLKEDWYKEIYYTKQKFRSRLLYKAHPLKLQPQPEATLAGWRCWGIWRIALKTFFPVPLVLSQLLHGAASCAPILIQACHPWPLLMLLVVAHETHYSNGGATLIALGSLPSKVMLQRDTDSKVAVNGNHSKISPHGPDSFFLVLYPQRATLPPTVT